MNLLAKYPYLVWQIVFIYCPLLITWLVWGGLLKRYLKLYPPAIFFSALWGYLFEIRALDQGIWWFNQTDSIGINFIGLPIEEWAFLLLVPILLINLFIIFRNRYQIGNG